MTQLRLVEQNCILTGIGKSWVDLLLAQISTTMSTNDVVGAHSTYNCLPAEKYVQRISRIIPTICGLFLFWLWSIYVECEVIVVILLTLILLFNQSQI